MMMMKTNLVAESKWTAMPWSRRGLSKEFNEVLKSRRGFRRYKRILSSYIDLECTCGYFCIGKVGAYSIRTKLLSKGRGIVMDICTVIEGVARWQLT